VERLLGEGVTPFRDKVQIATKFGWNIDQETGQRRPGLNSKPEHVKLVVEGMLKRLRTDRIVGGRRAPARSLLRMTGSVINSHSGTRSATVNTQSDA